MSRLGRITRRGFLVTGVAMAGGAAFGVWKAREVPPNPLRPGAGSVALNPWVVIDRRGVTLITPRAEMGQGTQTTLAALLAEELDMAWEEITVRHGPPAQAYFNGALLEAGLPFKHYAMSPTQDWLAERTGVVAKVLALQVTGGSTAMRDGYEKMRAAGAGAREALKEAAADRLGVARARLRTENGRVIAPDGTALSYGELAEAAAGARISGEIALRDRSQWKYLGKPMPRLDMAAKCTGTARFGIDVRLEGMKFAAIRMNPRLGGPMKRFDPAPALAMAGVEKVIDLDTGIAVVASNTWLAFRAAQAVEIEWGPAPYPDSTEAVMARIEAAFEGRRNSALRDDGDADGALAGAGEVIEAEYRAPFLAHATMEPMNATALFEDGRLTLWCGNQTPVLQRDKAARALGLRPEAVSVHTTFMGGGFGRRTEFEYSVHAARVAAAMPGVPVQLFWSREEDMRHDFYRPAAIARFRARVENGRAVALEGRIAAPSLTRASVARVAGFSPLGPDRTTVEGAFDQPYAIANYRIEGYLADLEVPIGYWRSVGYSFNGFFHESIIDEMAVAAGADPLAFRLQLVAPAHPPSANLLEAVREMSGWTGRTPAGLGRGVALSYSFGTPVAQVIEVADEDGAIRIRRGWIACDVGVALDPSIIEAQMISGAIYGLSAAVNGEITFAGGEVEQFNFPDADPLRMHNTPRFEVSIFENNRKLGGVGEPGTPPAMPALANAVFDLTGKRPRSLPLSRDFTFLA